MYERVRFACVYERVRFACVYERVRFACVVVFVLTRTLGDREGH